MSTSRLLLLGWDAADWQIIRPLLEAGRMPNLQRLIDEGCSGPISTLSPVVSPILWNSIATGKRADRHGILGFVEPRPDGQGIRPVASTSRRAKALWNILSQQGRRSIVVDWYASHPAENIHGCIVSNQFQATVVGREPIPEGTVFPPDLEDIVASLRVTPADLTEAQVGPFFLERLPANDDPRLQGFATLLAQNASIHNAATCLAQSEEWDFLAVYYDFIDHACHGFMEYRAPRLSHVSEDDFLTYGNLIDRVYEYHDLQLGRWRGIVGKDCTIMIVSDHGFVSGAARPLLPAWLPGIDKDARGINRNPLVWHRSHGIFAAAGPGVRAGGLVHGAGLLDVAPTVLALLGEPVPKDMDGCVLETILEGRQVLRGIDSYEPPHPDDGVWREQPSDETDPWLAQAALRQFVELGYIEAPEEDAAKAIETAELVRLGHLAQVYLGSDRPAEALPLLRELCSRQEDASNRAREAMCLLALGRLDEASLSVERAIALNPQAPLARLLTAWITLLRGNAEEAHRLLSDIHADDEYLPFIQLQIGATFLRQMRWADAAAAFRRVLESDADSAEAHDGLGVALREQGQLEDAIFHHMRAASLQLHRAQTHVNLGISLVLQRQYDWAIRAFEVASQMAPAEPFPERCLARIYFSVKKDRAKGRVHAAEMLRRRHALRDRVPGLSVGT